MTLPARRVHTVRLQAESQALVRRGAILLEDALRTASLPDAQTGRLLIFRSLDVGHIDSDGSPAGLALSIEQRVREIARFAVHGQDPSAVGAACVYFHDDAEPFVALAHRLACGQSAGAWFWPLAVAGFDRQLPRDDSLRLVLMGALRSTAGPAAALRLVESLGARQIVAPLLRALRRAEGAALLEAFGWPLPRLPIGFVHPAPPEELDALYRIPLGVAVTTWAPVWGEDDPRSIWLAAMALAAGSPGLLLLRSLVRHAHEILVALKGKPGTSMRHAGPDPGEFPPPEPSPDGLRVRHELRRPEQRGREAIALQLESMRRAPVSLAAGKADATVLDKAMELDSAAAGLSGNTHSADAASIEVVADRSRPPAALPPRTDLPSASPAEPTTIGGLFFLLPILERLGFVEFLSSHEELVKSSLPFRILDHVARCLGTPENDPVFAALHRELPMDLRRDYPFTLPERFHTIAGKPGPLVFASSGPTRDRLIVYDASRRLPLAVIHAGSTPEAAPWMNAHRSVQEPEAGEGETDMNLLLRGLLVAVRRFGRQRVRIGLFNLVRRPGRFVSTPTHMDVLFDHRQVDIRVRRAGIDIDPGWVPWMGRVVRFHYLYGERDE